MAEELQRYHDRSCACKFPKRHSCKITLALAHRRLTSDHSVRLSIVHIWSDTSAGYWFTYLEFGTSTQCYLFKYFADIVGWNAVLLHCSFCALRSRWSNLKAPLPASWLRGASASCLKLNLASLRSSAAGLWSSVAGFQASGHLAALPPLLCTWHSHLGTDIWHQWI